jgi:hypothetical protein
LFVCAGENTRIGDLLDAVRAMNVNLHVILCARQPDVDALKGLLQHAQDIILPPFSAESVRRRLQELVATPKRRSSQPGSGSPRGSSGWQLHAEGLMVKGHAWDIPGVLVAVIAWTSDGVPGTDFANVWTGIHGNRRPLRALEAGGQTGVYNVAAYNALRLLHRSAWLEKCARVCTAEGLLTASGLSDAVCLATLM